jgi:hypothetical protein
VETMKPKAKTGWHESNSKYSERTKPDLAEKKFSFDKSSGSGDRMESSKKDRQQMLSKSSNSEEHFEPKSIGDSKKIEGGEKALQRQIELEISQEQQFGLGKKRVSGASLKKRHEQIDTAKKSKGQPSQISIESGIIPNNLAGSKGKQSGKSLVSDAGGRRAGSNVKKSYAMTLDSLANIDERSVSQSQRSAKISHPLIADTPNSVQKSHQSIIKLGRSDSKSGRSDSSGGGGLRSSIDGLVHVNNDTDAPGRISRAGSVPVDTQKNLKSNGIKDDDFMTIPEEAKHLEQTPKANDSYGYVSNAFKTKPVNSKNNVKSQELTEQEWVQKLSLIDHCRGFDNLQDKMGSVEEVEEEPGTIKALSRCSTNKILVKNNYENYLDEKAIIVQRFVRQRLAIIHVRALRARESLRVAEKFFEQDGEFLVYYLMKKINGWALTAYCANLSIGSLMTPLPIESDASTDYTQIFNKIFVDLDQNQVFYEDFFLPQMGSGNQEEYLKIHGGIINHIEYQKVERFMKLHINKFQDQIVKRIYRMDMRFHLIGKKARHKFETHWLILVYVNLESQGVKVDLVSKADNKVAAYQTLHNSGPVFS